MTSLFSLFFQYLSIIFLLFSTFIIISTTTCLLGHSGSTENVEVVHLGKVVEILEGLPTVIHYRGGTVEAAVLVELAIADGFKIEYGIKSLGHTL